MSKLLLRNWEKSENSFFYKNSHLIQKFAADRMNNPVEEHYNIQTFSESGAITDDVTDCFFGGQSSLLDGATFSSLIKDFLA